MATFIVHPNDETQPKLSISFIKLQKGKPLIMANEYIFKLNKTTATTKYWKCTFNGCSSKIHTDLDDKSLKTIDDHSHPPEKENIEAREKVKQRAMNETTPSPHIFDEECEKAKLANATIDILPSERDMSMKHIL